MVRYKLYGKRSIHEIVGAKLEYVERGTSTCHMLEENLQALK